MCGVGLTGWLCGRVGQCPDGSSPYPEWGKMCPRVSDLKESLLFRTVPFIFHLTNPLHFHRKVALSSLTLWWCHRYLKSLSYHPSSTDKWCPHSGRCPDTGWWRWRPHHWGPSFKCRLACEEQAWSVGFHNLFCDWIYRLYGKWDAY